MRVVTTGSQGFIGGRLCRALGRAGCHSFGLDKRIGSSTADLDGLVLRLQAERPDVIVHLGAQCSTQRSFDDPHSDFIDNALGTVNVAEAARQAGGIPVVYVSTCKVTAGADSRVAPLGMSKMIGEDYLRLYRQEHNLPSVILRPSTVYGPGQDGTSESGWVTWFARAAVGGVPITVNGDGRQSRDVLFVDDFVDLLVDVATHFDDYDDALRGAWAPVGGGHDNEVSLLALLAELGHTAVMHGPPLPADLRRVVTDNWLVSSVRGWKPTVGWRDGLARTVAWLKEER